MWHSHAVRAVYLCSGRRPYSIRNDMMDFRIAVKVIREQGAIKVRKVYMRQFLKMRTLK